MYDWLNNLFGQITTFIADFTALFSLIILAVLFFVLDFKFLIRASRMIDHLFKGTNIPFWQNFILPWRLKKIDSESKETKYKYLKAFCEYSIFETKGEKLSHSEWNKLINVFFYEHILSEPFTISLDSSFNIISGNVEHSIKSYFEFLNKNSKKYYHNRAKSKFICKLKFENGFVYPSTFINGLERKFSDSWTDLLVKYSFTLKNSNYYNSKDSASIIKAIKNESINNFIYSQNKSTIPLLSNELFMMYSWLMWSPSYQVDFKDDKYKLILYGIGDESNTVNLILDTSDASNELWETLKSNLSKNVYGVNLSIECELYELTPFLHYNIQNFSIESMPLLNNLKNNSNDIHFVLSYLNPTENSNLKNCTINSDNNEFFSGYLWSVFSKETNQQPKFEIKNSVVFFEHCNLADPTSINYFTKCMATKTILHFKEILNKDSNSYYSLASCVSKNFKLEYINLLNEELKKESSEFQKLFKKHVDLNKSSVTLNEILENIDEEFPLNEFEYVQVTSAKEIADFYASIYVKNFAPDERDSIDDLINRTLELKSENHHDIIVAKQNNEVVGGIVFDWFKKSNCGLIEYIVVDNKFRGMRIAQKLVAKATALMTHYSGKKKLNGIFIEIEDPEKLDISASQAAVDNYRRLQLWSNHKFNRLDINYVQPALAEGLNKLDNLMLAVNTLNSDDEFIDAKIVESMLVDFNKICNRVEDINDPNTGIKDMLDEIRSKENGKIKILPNSLDFEKYNLKNLKKNKKKKD